MVESYMYIHKRSSYSDQSWSDLAFLLGGNTGEIVRKINELIKFAEKNELLSLIFIT